MSLSIYLFYPGNCAEAFDFYRAVFGGDFQVSTTFAEGPPDMGVTGEDLDKIMHISYQIGESVLMGSDSVASCGGVQPAGGSFAISYSPASKEEAEEVFNKLFEGGEIQMELAETFWGSYFGSGKDRFGITWMINVNL
jgi:PhnB protein